MKEGVVMHQKRAFLIQFSKLALYAVLAGIGVSSRVCQAEIINPSLETGDLTGWTAMGFEIGSDGGSDGTFYLKATSPGGPPPPSPAPDHGPVGWAATGYQIIDIPPWATGMSIDVRNDGLAESSFGAGLAYAMVSLTGNFTVDFIAEGTPSQALNGFTRYTVDVSSGAGLGGLELRFWAAGALDMNGTLSVDNVQFIPEPGTLSCLMLVGSIHILRRTHRVHCQERPQGRRARRTSA